MVKPRSNLGVITANFSGVRNFLDFYGDHKITMVLTEKIKSLFMEPCIVLCMIQ